ncbi:aldo/keto reductase [Pengzhenrongella sp.]|jgi:D-threo-aldose 1-dehydrogenase|uniref:aldo/keto reductase n=1 Tax=Pengzhenrongella sp. TaxID=2888820 RepID=UPI002F9227D2
MDVTRLPRRDLALTAVGVGAAQFGNLYRPSTDAELEGAVQAAWDQGIRYFDTAPHYGLGLSERRLGALLGQFPRDEIVVSTKAGRLLRPSPETAHLRDVAGGFDVPADVRREWDFSAAGVRRSLEESLERSGLDRFDIVYLHDPDDHGAQAREAALPELARMRDEGIIGAIGAGMNQSAMLADFVRDGDIDVVMLAGRYTLLEQSALDDLLPLAVERGVGVVIAGVYNSGLLARPRPPADARYNYQQAPPELLARVNRIADLCEAHGVTLPDAAVRFALAHPAVVSTVIGVRTHQQVTQAAQRAATDVPVSLWADLVAAGLLRADAPVPTAVPVA